MVWVYDGVLLTAQRHGMSENFTAATLEAYERWAPRYPPVAHNPLMRAEQRAMLEHWPQVAGRSVLDLACGSGRYSRLLVESRAADIVALDFSTSMLAQVSTAHRVQADMMQLPFANDVFDAVISGLALGHASHVGRWMKEVARVLRRGGTLLYSDFHPEAALRKLTRSFDDDTGRSYTVPYYYHDLAAQKKAAVAAGMQINIIHEIRVGGELKEPFANSKGFYERWDGLPIVLIVQARK